MGFLIDWVGNGVHSDFVGSDEIGKGASPFQLSGKNNKPLFSPCSRQRYLDEIFNVHVHDYDFSPCFPNGVCMEDIPCLNKNPKSKRAQPSNLHAAGMVLSLFADQG